MLKFKDVEENKYSTYLLDGVFMSEISLITKRVILENRSRYETRSGLDDIGSNILLREGDHPSVIARNIC
jgi:hypothetical protein